MGDPGGTHIGDIDHPDLGPGEIDAEGFLPKGDELWGFMGEPRGGTVTHPLRGGRTSGKSSGSIQMMLSSGLSVLSRATSLRVSRNSKPSVGWGRGDTGQGCGDVGGVMGTQEGVMGTQGRDVGTLGRDTGWGCGDMEWVRGAGAWGHRAGTWEYRMGTWDGDVEWGHGDTEWGHGMGTWAAGVPYQDRPPLQRPRCESHQCRPPGGETWDGVTPGVGGTVGRWGQWGQPPQTHPCLIHTLRFELPQRCPGGWGEGSLRGAMRGPRAPQIPVGLGSFWGGRGIDPSALITPPPLPSCLPRPLSPHKLISPPGLTPPSPTVTRNPPSPGVPLPPITSPWQPSPVATIPPATTSPRQPHPHGNPMATTSLDDHLPMATTPL